MGRFTCEDADRTCLAGVGETGGVLVAPVAARSAERVGGEDAGEECILWRVSGRTPCNGVFGRPGVCEDGLAFGCICFCVGVLGLACDLA